jgi:molecular chaperone DnaK
VALQRRVEGQVREPVVGIDLGTSNSVVATVERGGPRVIPSRVGGRLTPSLVGFLPSGDRVVGERARLLAEELPENVAAATKRFIGRRWTPAVAATARSFASYGVVGGPKEEIRVKLGGRTLPVTQIAAMVLVELRLDAQQHFGRSVRRAVITVPANFDDGQRSATREAARIAGLETLRLVNEPTAAALAFGLGSGFVGHCVVFDLGGGTFDASVLEVRDGVFEVRATGGDPFLGGIDFDQKIVEWFLERLAPTERALVAGDKLSLQKVKVAAERAKQQLTSSEQALLALDGLGPRRDLSLGATLSRDLFETLCDPLAGKCIATCARVVEEAKLRPEQVGAVLLVGGMTRVPLVRQLVADFFNQAPNCTVDPDEAVALGAAIQAAELAEQRKAALLIDVASHSIGVKIAGGRMRRLIARNTAIPVVAREVFVPARAEQTQVRIPILQGEGDRAEQNTPLGELVLRDLEQGDRAERGIEVTFELSADGILSVRATDQRLGISDAATLESRAQLGEAEAQALADEQAAYLEKTSAEDDEHAAKALKRLLTRANRTAEGLRQSAGGHPPPDLVASIGALDALAALGQAAIESGQPEEIAAVRTRLARVLRAQ